MDKNKVSNIMLFFSIALIAIAFFFSYVGKNYPFGIERGQIHIHIDGENKISFPTDLLDQPKTARIEPSFAEKQAQFMENLPDLKPAPRLDPFQVKSGLK